MCGAVLGRLLAALLVLIHSACMLCHTGVTFRVSTISKPQITLCFLLSCGSNVPGGKNSETCKPFRCELAYSVDCTQQSSVSLEVSICGTEFLFIKL